MKLIDAEKLKAEVERRRLSNRYIDTEDYEAELFEIIDSLQQEQQDFPTTDEQVKEFLATHPKIKVPEKYKNPDWVFKKQEQQEEPGKSLEEAAQQYAEGPECTWVGTTALEEAFKAGAEWQKEQMMDEWLKDRDGCFWDGVNEGKKAMEEQMLKAAVEGNIHLVGFHNAIFIKEPGAEILDRYNVGDKVRIIIVKAEEE